MGLKNWESPEREGVNRKPDSAKGILPRSYDLILESALRIFARERLLLMSQFGKGMDYRQFICGDTRVPSMPMPVVVFSSPRKLPKAPDLGGRVIVLDVAFAGKGLGKSFDKSTGRLIFELGERLAAWVDHHDNERHIDYKGDPRFVLSTKSHHHACAEMITPELVERVGRVDTIVAHGDLDGLYSVAKWVLGGHPPYNGADADARAVDSRIGTPGDLGKLIDRALRARPRDEKLFNSVVRYLVSGCKGGGEEEEIMEAADEFSLLEAASLELAEDYRVEGRVAFVDIGDPIQRFDKTELLLYGQKLAPVAIVKQGQNVTAAAPYDSGLDFVEMLGLGGGMPTRVTVKAVRLEELMNKVNES